MKIKFRHGFFLTLLAIIFTIGLTFASVELPRLVDSFMGRNINFLDVATGSGVESEYKTELYFQYYNLRIIGYAFLALIIILIIIGFITNRTGLTSAGAIVLFLPVFGHFAATMFFLGGLGLLRLIWMPFMDISFDVLRLGDIIYFPYRILLDILSFVGVSIRRQLPYAITGIGLLIFFSGTLTWFYSRIQKKRVADFWIYRISRHPQYLGWIIWSYGIIFLPGSNSRIMFDISNSLPWLLSTMIIIGVAMLEELKMRRLQGEVYESYCRRTSFLLPLPRFVAKIFSFPLRFMFKKECPERKLEIVAILALYTGLSLAISVFYTGFIPIPEKKEISSENFQQRIDELLKIVDEAKSEYDKMQAIALLGEIGEPAVETLVSFLKSEQNYIRRSTASALGNTKSDKAVDPLIALLYDENRNVRSSTVNALGKIGSKRAVQPLIEAFWDEERNLSALAAMALGRIGDQEAVSTLIRSLEEMENCPFYQVGWALWNLDSDRSTDAFLIGLKDDREYSRSACVSALGKIKSERAIEPIIEALQDESERVRRAAALALMEIKSKRAVEALVDALNDKDFEVRMYAKEAIKRISESDVPATLKD